MEYIQLVSQDLSGFFTSIPTERFHQALQVLLHRYDQVVGLRNTSHWSVYGVKSDHRRRVQVAPSNQGFSDISRGGPSVSS